MFPIGIVLTNVADKLLVEFRGCEGQVPGIIAAISLRQSLRTGSAELLNQPSRAFHRLIAPET